MLSESLTPEALKALTTIAGQEPMCMAEIGGVGLTNLTVGPATDTLFTDVGIEHLKELRELRGLDLSGTALTDDGIKHLGTLPQLVRLKLNGTQVSDMGLEHLEPLTNLTLLELRGTTVSDEAVRRIEKAFPYVEIVR